GLAPLLPVKQSTAAIAWPQGANADGFVSDITAPLVSGAPRSLDVTIPCRTVATLPSDDGVVFSTIPSGGIDAGRNGLFVRANADVVYVAFRDTVAAVAPRDAVDSGACSELRIWANVGAVGADFVGIPGATGTLPPDKRPQVAGVFTDLEVPVDAGLNARIDVDTRFITTPTALKLAVLVLGVLCVIASIVALAVLDRSSGRKVPRELRRHRRAGLWTWLTDAAVIGGLLVWHMVGAQSSDDGYNVTIARVSGEAGYLTNYYRYFGASEAPFDWYQSVLAHLASVSTAG
ncbi:arabinosyltransferase, partial [Mycobacterium sp. ITM-2017-0098]